MFVNPNICLFDECLRKYVFGFGNLLETHDYNNNLLFPSIRHMDIKNNETHLYKQVKNNMNRCKQ